MGKCQWKDGSTYEGEWKNNLRDGNGKYSCKEYDYAGQWAQDMRHGRCKYIIKSKKGKDGKDTGGENPILGSFENDKANGVATQDAKTVLFKNGMRVDLSGKDHDCCQIYRPIY